MHHLEKSAPPWLRLSSGGARGRVLDRSESFCLLIGTRWTSANIPISAAVWLGAPAFCFLKKIGGSLFDFGPLRVALCSNDTLRLYTRLAVLQQGVCGRIPAASHSRSHNHTRPMRRPPAEGHRKHDSHSLFSRQTIRRTAAFGRLSRFYPSCRL